MKILTPEEVGRKIKKGYNNHPPGWRFVYIVDRGGNLSTGVVNPIINVQYWLCYTSLHGGKAVGFEGTLGEDFPFKKSEGHSKDFGVRYVDMDDSERESALRTGRMPMSVIRKLRKAESKAPEQFDEDKDRRMASVVVHHTNMFLGLNLSDISPSQAEIEARMREEVSRMKRELTRYVS